LSKARPLPPRSASLALALATATTALFALGGCGSSPSGTSASPATVVPASAPLYIDAVVTPAGSLKTDALAAGRRLTQRSNPFAGLLKLLQGPTGKVPDYAHEVKPWLGPNAGVFISSIDVAGASGASGAQGLLGEAVSKGLAEGLAGAEAALLGSSGLPRLLGEHAIQGALVLDTTNVTGARSFLEGQARSAGARTSSYRGVAFHVAPDGIAEGIVHRFAVIGSEAGLQAVIDTALGGAPLAQGAAYSKLTATAEPGRLADAYIDAEALTRAVKVPGEEQSLLRLLRGLLGEAGQVYLSLIPSASSVALDVDTLPSSAAATGAASTGSSSSAASGQGTAAGGSGTTGAQVLRGLPGSAWLVLGIGDLGKTLGHSAQALQTLASLASGISLGSFSLSKVFAPLHSRSIDVSRDLLSWMGATGIYAGGSSVLNLQAAVVITSKNPALSRAAVVKLANAYREAGGQVSPTGVAGTEVAVAVRLPNFPLVLTLAAGQGKFVAGIGPASVQEALNPQSTLAGTTVYETAASALGQGIQPSAAIEFRTLLGLLESVGLNQAAGFSNIFTALQPLNNLAAGGGEPLADGVKRARLVLGLAPAG
jgi:hypothetical protein